ncbi:unnamed protein product [Notodromas monacha]|uniref:Mediator of RNA polymerase II transcription subunit 10 n=1 Tax=Notodromas monacha TaxID=399045 RepID=A0A7R9BM51_9CRUS|nr:unnamed protein product [Notodromas monacha]CAG0916932.1 unnamed protein product [Notodromas monacha]
MSSASGLEQLENQLEGLIENVRQIGIVVSDFQPQGQNSELLSQLSNVFPTEMAHYRLNRGEEPSGLEQLENQLEGLIENVRQIGIVVSDFQPQGQNVLNSKIHAVVAGMQEINKLRSHPSIQDIQVPLEVFDYIDEGRNPQLYTKDCMEKALSKNEQVKGKIDAYSRFKSELLSQLSNVFPTEMAQYRAIRGEERASL